MYVPRGLDRGIETLKRVRTLDCNSKILTILDEKILIFCSSNFAHVFSK